MCTSPNHLCAVLFGYLVDILSSRRAIFISALLVIILSTLTFALATKLWVLLVARLLQGLSTACVVSVGYVLLAEVVGPAALGKAMGYTAMAVSLALMAGPVIGGFLYEYCGYLAVFWPMFGLFAIELVLRLMIVEEKAEDKDSSKPSLAEPAETTRKASSDEDANKQIESQLLLDQKEITSHSFLDGCKALLSSPRYLVALFSYFVQETIFCGFSVILAPYLRDTFNVRASSAASIYLALAAPMLFSPIVGSLVDRFGPRFPTAVGLALGVLSNILLSLITPATVSPLPKLAAILVLLGLDVALSLPPLDVEVGLVIEQLKEMQPALFGPKGAYGRAYGMINLAAGAAIFVGPLFSGAVRVAAGWRVLAWVNTGLSVVVLVLVGLITGDRRKGSKVNEEAGV